MNIGIPKEFKNNKSRVGMTPAGVLELTKALHEVFVQSTAGIGSGFSDEDYKMAGAIILPDLREVYEASDFIVKVKEPIEEEYTFIKEGQVVFTYFHFASNEKLARAMIKSKAVGIAYETVQDGSGALPLLTPMSEVAGRMPIQQRAKYLERPVKGKGLLLGGPGDPVYIIDKVVHYCVSHMPGAVPHTSTIALKNFTLPYVLQLAELGWAEAGEKDEALSKGLNIVKGKVVCHPILDAFGWEEPVL